MVWLTFSIDYDFRMISIRSHQNSFIVYLFLGQSRLSIDNFEKLHSTISCRHLSYIVYYM